MVLEYYLLLRSALKNKPHLRRCLKRCRHCRIFFLTDPRNAGRKDMQGVGREDLRCPFGCRQEHRRRESIRRSVAYYRSEKGRKRKQQLNQRRRQGGPLEPPTQASPPDPEEFGHPSQELVEHLQVAVGLIEGRRIRREQILCLVEKVLRQPRMARVRRMDQIIDHLNEHPP